MNNVNLIGHMTRDADIKYLASGTAVAEIGVAVNDRVKRGNEWVDEVSFIDCTAFGRTAEVVSEYAGKGSQIGISGKLKQDRWESDGQKRSKVKVIIDRLTLLGAKREKEAVAAKPEEDDDVPF